jgi:hypothetical protein
MVAALEAQPGMVFGKTEPRTTIQQHKNHWSAEACLPS